jgi:hypothetical protein
MHIPELFVHNKEIQNFAFTIIQNLALPNANLRDKISMNKINKAFSYFCTQILLKSSLLVDLVTGKSAGNSNNEIHF